MTVQILVGDVMDVLDTLPGESVHCVVTSPPYWGLRDYGVAGQIGMELTLGEHIDVLVGVFREVRRVLRKDGTLWLNYGDCYATSPNGRSAAETKAAGNDDRTFRDKPFSTIGPIRASRASDETRGKNSKEGYRPCYAGRVCAGGYVKPKDLCMVSNRLAIALQEDGWWVRSEIIWHKPNPMPESIRDRPGASHEKVWLLSKSERYFYDAAAVRKPPKESTIQRLSQNLEAQAGSSRANGGRKTNGPMKAVGCGSDKQRGHSRRHAGFNDRWDAMERPQQMAGGANLRNVWTISARGFKGAHFATFPTALVEPCIKAGTSEKGCCARCGAPWVRAVRREFVPQGDVAADKGARGVRGQKPFDATVHTEGWTPSCKCPAHDPVPCIVLDLFGGAGTTGLVAQRLGRKAILIELNPAYADMARQRIDGDVFA